MDKLETNSWYRVSANSHESYPAQQGNIECDVCVLGGGVSGLSCAYHLAKKNYKVALIEKEHIGFGASGRNGGQFIHGYSCEMSKVRKLVGLEKSKRLFQLSLDSLEFVKDFVKEHRIDCDLTMGHHNVAVLNKHIGELKKTEEEYRRIYGFDELRYLGANEIKTLLATKKYPAGIYHGGSGHLHPLNYTLGMAKAAQDAGVKIYEKTSVEKILNPKEKILLTSGGKLKYKFLILAGNAYLKGINAFTESRVMPVGTYIAATEVLGKEKALSLIKDNSAVSDMNFVLDYYRLSSDWRLLFGGRVSYSTLNPVSVKYSIYRRIIDVFPQLKGIKIEYGWGGFVAITINRFPSFGRLKNDVYYLQGFSGHGVSLSGFAGKLLAEALHTDSSDFDLFASVKHLPFPGGRLIRTPALVLAMLYHKMKDKIDFS